MVLQTPASNPHNNDEHDPGFVKDTGDTITGTLTVSQLNTSIVVNQTGGEYLIINQTGSTGGIGIKSNVFFPVQAATSSAPTYVKGGIYFDTTLNKLRIGGATDWETVTSV